MNWRKQQYIFFVKISNNQNWINFNILIQTLFFMLFYFYCLWNSIPRSICRSFEKLTVDRIRNIYVGPPPLFSFFYKRKRCRMLWNKKCIWSKNTVFFSINNLFFTILIRFRMTIRTFHRKICIRRVMSKEFCFSHTKKGFFYHLQHLHSFLLNTLW